MWFSVLKLLHAIKPGAGEGKPGLGAEEAYVYGDSLGLSCEMANHLVLKLFCYETPSLFH